MLTQLSGSLNEVMNAYSAVQCWLQLPLHVVAEHSAGMLNMQKSAFPALTKNAPPLAETL